MSSVLWKLGQKGLIRGVLALLYPWVFRGYGDLCIAAEGVKPQLSIVLFPDREVPTVRALRRTGTGEAIETAVCEAFGVSPDVLRQRGRWHNEARAVAVYLCRKWTGAPEGELGGRFGGVGGAAPPRPASGSPGSPM